MRRATTCRGPERQRAGPAGAGPRWRRAALVAAAVSAWIHTGCSEESAPAPPGTPEPGLFTDNVLVVDGVSRSYDYYVPAGMGTEPRPLVILLHGGASHPDDLTGRSGFKAPYRVWMDVADEEKLVLAYPRGAESPLEALGWNDCRADATTNPSVDDVGFLDALLGELSSSLPIDADRVYASGTSNGGHMSLRLALELSDRVAAVAPVVAAMPAVPCSAPDQPVSVLFMNGTADPLLPWEGGPVAPEVGGRGTALSAQASAALWVDFLQADATPVVRTFPDLETRDGSSVRSLTWANGAGGTQVVLYQV